MTPNIQPHWRERFFDMARLVASWSKDPSTQVGAVIVDSRKRVVSVGFNGFPSGVEDDPEHLADRERKLAMTLHAEENAILFAQRDLTGCAIFTWPLPPCARCAAKIVQAGIGAVYMPDIEMAPERWKNNMLLAAAIMEEAGVDMVPMEEQRKTTDRMVRDLFERYFSKCDQEQRDSVSGNKPPDPL